MAGRICRRGARKERAEERRANGATNLLGGVHHRGGDARLGGIDSERRGTERWRKDAAHPDAKDEQRRHDMARVAGAWSEAGEEEHRDHTERHPDGHERLSSRAEQHLCLHRRGGHDKRSRHRQKRQTRLHGREAEILLHVVRQEEEDRKHPRSRERDRQVDD
jgi:hypothetical protein